MIIDELVAILGFDFRGEGDLNRFNTGVEKAASGLSRFATIAGAAAAAAGAALAGGLAVLGKSVISTSAEFEKLEATLITIEGSADKARASLDWVADFAKRTPYDVKQVSEAFIRLKAYGLDPTQGLLEDLGNASSAMGKDLMAAVEMIADASTGEFERLKEFGVRASQAGNQVTFSWTENGKTLTKTVKKTGQEITQFIQERFAARFNGAMERQSKTWSGMLSNLGDSWTGFLRKIGDAGFFDAVRSQLGKALQAIDRWNGDGSIDKLAKSLSAAMTWAAKGVGLAVSQIVRHITFLFDNFQRFEPYIRSIGIALGLLVAWAFPVITAIAGIALVVDEFLTYLEGGETIIGKFAEALAQLTGIDEGMIAGILAALAVGGIGLAAAVGPIRLMGLALRALATSLGLMGGATVAKGIANVGAAGAAAGGVSSALRVLGGVGLGVAGEAAILKGGEAAIMNDPKKRQRTEEGNAWIERMRKKAQEFFYGGGSDKYAGEAAGAKGDAANNNFLQAAEDRLNNARTHMQNMSGANAAQSVQNTVNDSSDRSTTVNVGGVVVNGVQNVTPAVGAAVGQAVGSAAAGASAPPARVVGGGL